MALRPGDPPLKGIPRRYVVGLVVAFAAAMLVSLIALFVFRTAVPLVVSVAVMLAAEVGIYLWWRRTAPEQ